MPTYSPASVAAFLFEAAATLTAANNQKTTYALADLVAEARTDDWLRKLRDEAKELVGAPQGRGQVIALIAYTESLIAGTDFRRLTGVPPDSQLTLADWATWIFRELQAARATIGSSGKPKRPSRKV